MDNILHNLVIEKERIILDGFELRGVKEFQLKYPPDPKCRRDAADVIGELTIVLDIKTPQFECMQK